jgi:hypothetical protein
MINEWNLMAVNFGRTNDLPPFSLQTKTGCIAATGF